MTTTDLLHVTYSDVCGPFEVPSLEQNKYFVSFVDEYNKMLWVYLIKAKSDVLQHSRDSRLLLKIIVGKL